MKKQVAPSIREQERVNAYFQSQSTFWKDIYAGNDVYARIHQHRHAAALTWIDSLSLAPGSRVLEIGCGAGFISIALAQRGLHVQAIDSTEAMLEQVRRNAEASGVTLSPEIGNATSLAFNDDSFDLVVALGVIPWLEQPGLAIQEMARVTKPGGHIVFSADNRTRLTALLDPLLHPLVVPLKRGIKAALHSLGLRHLSSGDVGARLHSRRFIDKAVLRAGLSKTRSKTLGFGPFTLFRRIIIPESLGIKLHLRLQFLADQGVFGFRSTGAHYLVLASKPECLSTFPANAGDTDSNALATV